MLVKDKIGRRQDWMVVFKRKCIWDTWETKEKKKEDWASDHEQVWLRLSQPRGEYPVTVTLWRSPILSRNARPWWPTICSHCWCCLGKASPPLSSYGESWGCSRSFYRNSLVVHSMGAPGIDSWRTCGMKGRRRRSAVKASHPSSFLPLMYQPKLVIHSFK